jgi:hypothetical protein
LESRSILPQLPSAPAIAENLTCKKLWSEKTSTPFHQALADTQWAWVGEPFIPCKFIGDVRLFYHKTWKRYKIPSKATKPFERWCASTQKAKKLLKEPWGLQVRLEGSQFNHRAHAYEIHLTPTKFLFYSAIQRNLGNVEYRHLRESVFENALNGLCRGDVLLLPSTFAIHMCVVSSDGAAFLRRRTDLTDLYPLAWEAGIGEFMHGPFLSKFRHFTKDGQPSLFLYLRNAVAEELNYYGARVQDFRIYGFAAEYRTLAPKLMVVYFSDLTIARLMRRAPKSKDPAVALASVPLTVDGVGAAVVSPQFPDWGPTSKLGLLLALIERSGSTAVVEQLNARRQWWANRARKKPSQR